MDTTNSSENPQRRVEDRKPNETINWEAPGAPAVPLSAAANERGNLPIRYVASLQVNSGGASVFTTPDAARLPHGHYMLSVGTAPASSGWYGDLCAEPESEQLKQGRASIANYRGELHTTRTEGSAAPAPTGTDEFMVYGRAGNRRADLEAKLRDALAAGMPGPAATSGDAPDLQQLKALALAATPGPWKAEHWNCHAETTVMRAEYVTVIAETTGFGRDSGECIPDAAYIAAANPAVVLGLIARIERLNTAFELARANYEQVVAKNAELNARIESAAAPATASGDELPPLTMSVYGTRTNLELERQRRADIAARAAVSAATKPTADCEHCGTRRPLHLLTCPVAVKGMAEGRKKEAPEPLRQLLIDLSNNTYFCGLHLSDDAKYAAYLAAAEKAEQSLIELFERATTPEAPALHDIHHAIMAMECKATWSQFANSTDFAKHKGGYHEAKLDAAELVQSLLATKPAAVPAVPEGWKLVPVVPTHEMVRAACDAMSVSQGLRLAIKAAPAIPIPATQQFGQSHVLPPTRGAESQQDANSAADDQWIFDLAAKHELRSKELFGPITFSSTAIIDFVRDVGEELASRCRAQGGNTNDTNSGNSAASTTGAAQTAEQVRNDALEEAASVYMVGAVAAREIRKLKRPTPTHSSEAGDAS
ncbi:hypothetical protein [Massilia brevitalea]|uniref:hypothetical protein n=1 Tax=Massilia brevitalea TaxID=442526 RepID=UPI002738DB10|nr:hypothetical protein [Massilia brevitalea]